MSQWDFRIQGLVAPNGRQATFNFQPSTFNFQLSTFNLQLSTFNQPEPKTLVATFASKPPHPMSENTRAGSDWETAKELGLLPEGIR